MTIETLLGTSYEVKVSNKTNVGFLKAKLQRTEGIPRQCLHLVHRYVRRDSFDPYSLGDIIDFKPLHMTLDRYANHRDQNQNAQANQYPSSTSREC